MYEQKCVPRSVKEIKEVVVLEVAGDFLVASLII